jgi:hypothetical protein
MVRRSRGRGIIRGRRCPRIQLCPTCGQMRVHHLSDPLLPRGTSSVNANDFRTIADTLEARYAAATHTAVGDRAG